jgi:hypothetical protein
MEVIVGQQPLAEQLDEEHFLPPPRKLPIVAAHSGEA